MTENSTSALTNGTWRVYASRDRVLQVAVIVLLALATALFWNRAIPLTVLLVGVAIGLVPLIKVGVTTLIRERQIGTELFVTIATAIAIIGDEYIAGAVLLNIILIAEFIAELNTDRARASIKSLIGTVPKTATVRANGVDRILPVSELRAGDIVLVRGGDRIPVDGIVKAGQGAANEATITGESKILEKGINSSVLAGTILESGAIDVITERAGGDTLFARIIALVENADDQQAPVQKLADQVAGWLIPLVFVFLIGVYFYTRDLRMIVTLLIFTSPAELGLATPIVMIAAIARAAKGGVLIKGGLYLETLARADVMVFDKTGTLTLGEPVVSAFRTIHPSMPPDEIIALAASMDRRSSHPLAKSIVAYAVQQGAAIDEPAEFEMIKGRGVKGTVSGKRVLVGNRELMGEHNVTNMPSRESIGTVVYAAIDGVAAAEFELDDEIRPGAKEALERLKSSGVQRIVMLTGDNLQAARRIAAALSISEVKAGLLPDGKVNAIDAIRREGHTVVMVGDGVNDAPALARADAGIAMGARGTQAALEAADIALMTDDLSRIVFARLLAKRAYRTIQENIFVGVGVVHVLGITAALMGLIGPVQAALLHLGPDILVFLNSIKLLRVRLPNS